ncbi:transketolase family protein [Chloroflexota bacterium]
MTVSMRDAFIDELYDIALQDRRLIFLSNDFGAPSLDKFRENLPGQFIHIGIAEQNMVNVATGLAMAGKIVYMYSIAPFLPLRCLEQIRVHLSLKGVHVTGVMVGVGYSYDLSGPTHQALEDIAIMNALPGMTILTASDSAMGAAFAHMTYEKPGPKYVRFDREKVPSLYSEKEDFSSGIAILKEGSDLTIVATGVMVHRAFEVADQLARHSVDAGIIDLYQIKPLNEDLLLDAAGKTGRILTVEESFINSGIGSIISDLITDRGEDWKLKRLGIPDRFVSQGGDRRNLQRLSGLDVDSITAATLKWMKND